MVLTATSGTMPIVKSWAVRNSISIIVVVVVVVAVVVVVIVAVVAVVVVVVVVVVAVVQSSLFFQTSRFNWNSIKSFNIWGQYKYEITSLF